LEKFTEEISQDLPQEKILKDIKEIQKNKQAYVKRKSIDSYLM